MSADKELADILSVFREGVLILFVCRVSLAVVVNRTEKSRAVVCSISLCSVP